MTASPRLLSGPDAVKAAAQLKRSAKESFPYPWSFPPPASNHVFAHGTLSVPVELTESTVLTYQVPNNLLFCPVGVVFGLAGPSAAAWADGDGNVSWSINVDNTYSFKDYGAILWRLGSFAGGFPWPINPGEKSILTSRQKIRILVTVTSNFILPVDSAVFLAALVGHVWTP